MKRSAAIVLFTLPLAACLTISPPLYSGPPGATYQSFIDTRYVCYQETATRQYSAGINQYGGAATSTVAPTCSAFRACMASRGYFQSATGEFDPYVRYSKIVCTNP